MSSLGDMALGARSIADLYAQAAVDVYGLVGVAPAGESVARFQAANAIDVGAGATLESLRDIRLSAGASTADAANDIRATARTDVYNNTAIPVNRAPVADAIIGTHSQITVGSGADVAASRNVSLFADKGAATASGVGIGKDIYREALAAVASAISQAFGGGEVSFETRTGRSIRNQTSDVAADGDLRAGIHRKQELVIGVDGTATTLTGGISIAGTELKSVGDQITARINDLNKLILDYKNSDGSSDASIAVAAYESEIAFLKRKLAEIGFKAGAAPISPLLAAQQAVAGMTTTRSGYDTTRAGKIGENTTLTTDNTNRTTDNTNKANQNTTLSTVTIPALQAQIKALDPSVPAQAAQIAVLQGQIDGHQTTISNNNTAIAANNTAIGNNNTAIAANNTEITTLTGQIDSLDTQIGTVQAGIAAGSYSEQPASGPVAKFLTLSDAVAQLGNIQVRGDRLHGSGKLDAPGDAEIKITNTGPSFLILKNLTIPPDDGGKVYFNNVQVRTNAEIDNVNGPAGGAAFSIATAENQAKPRILVESKFDPLDPYYASQVPADREVLAPDIVLQGDISNLRGLVKIDSAAGSIRLEQKRDAAGNIVPPGETASVRADEVQIKTRNGDFVQSYTNTFVHTAGAPLAIVQGSPLDSIVRTPESAGAGIVANGSVLIAARYLNINGNIQSGIPEWGVRVPADATVTTGVGSGRSFAQAKGDYDALSPAQKAVPGAEYYDVSGATVAGLAGNVQGNWEKVSVRYNARENRLELGGVQVQGGYIELFGQVFNTNQSGGGKLQVLDGYGQIKVDNQTSLPLWLNLLDTGRGVAGEINITNISSVDANGNPVIATTSYTRDPGGARTGGFYNPASGLRYAMTVGSNSGKTDNYRYSQYALFGFAAFPPQVDQYWISSTFLNNDPLSRGEFLRPLPGSGSNHYFSRSQSTTVSGLPVTTRSWFECNWLTLCVWGTYYNEFGISSKTNTVFTDSVRADYPIAINFLGFDKGAVNVSSTGNVVMNASINNRDGNTSVASAGTITQSGALPIARGNNVNLSAGAGIGTGTQPVLVNVNDGGRLDATANSGDVRVEQVVGDLRVGTIGGAGVASVVLKADRNLLPWDASSYVQGKRVELLASNGGIGTLSGTVNDPLVVRTGYTADQTQWPHNGLKLSARDNINVRNDSGNLLLISAESLTGDVRVETTGSVIDNNPFATTDTRSQAELANLWDALRLRGALAAEKADEAVAAYENGKSAGYVLYWQMRKRQADLGAVYDPAFQYTVSPAENDVLAASGVNVAEFAAGRTVQYHQLHAEVGGLTAAFVPGYRYDASAAEEAQIRKGSSWTDAQLALSVGAGLLKNITDTVTTIKEPNAKGRNVTLVAGAGIGSFDAPLSIDLSPAGLAALTTEQKAALGAAERGDATVAGNIVTITQPRPVNVTTGTGALNATAGTGLAFIGSEQDLRIDRVSAAGEIRIKTAGSLVDAASTAGAANVVGGNMILEAANGGIGSIPDASGAVSAPLRVSPASGAGVIARAASDIWIETPQDLAADTVYSRGNLRLEAGGSILDFHSAESAITPDNNLRAGNMTLRALTGTIGTPGNPLDAGVNPDGLITAAATIGKGVYLNGPSGESFNIGSVTSGDAVSLSSATSMKIDGPVTAPGPIGLVSGGTMTMTPRADVHATTLGVFVRGGALTMEDATDGVNAARMRVDVGTIDIETVGDARITGIETGNSTENAIRVVSTAGRILDNGDTRLDIIADTPPAAKLTISGALGIGDDPLDVRLLNLQATSGGVVDLAVQGSVNIDAVSAGDRVLLTAGGNITGNSVSSTGAGTTNPDQSVSVTSASGSVTLASVTGSGDVAVSGSTGVAVGSVSAGQNASLSAPNGSVTAGTAAAGGTFTASSGTNVDVGAVTATSVALSAPGTVTADMLNVGSSLQLAGGNVIANVNGGAGTVTGSVTGFGGGIASDVNLTLSGAGGFAFGDFWTATASVNVPLGSFAISNALILDQATFTNPLSTVLVDQHDRSIQGSDVQLYSAGAPFGFSLSGNRLSTDAFVIYRSPRHEVVTPAGANSSLAEQGEGALAATMHTRLGRSGEPLTSPELDMNALPPTAAGGESSGTERRRSSLITFTGVPVSFETECNPELDPACAK